MWLLFHEFLHLSLSLVIWYIIYRYFYKSYFVFLLAIIWWFLIDVDHVLDFWILYPFSLDIKLFFSWNYFYETEKLYVIFHWREFSMILLIIFLLVKSKIRYLLLVLSLSIFWHLLIDTLSHNMKIQWYSIAYRVYTQFNENYFITNPKN